MSLVFKLISKSYDKKYVFENISVQLPNESVIGVIGQNGIGKTTLFKCLINLEKFDSGEIFEGENKIVIDSNDWKRQIGFLVEPNPLIDFYTLFENLTLKRIIRNLEKSKFQSNVEYYSYLFFNDSQFIKNCNLPIANFSTGMRKKALIVSSLIHEPTRVFWDEPFSGLDIDTKHKLVDLVINKSTNGTFFLISDHEDEFIKKLTSVYLIMEENEWRISCFPQKARVL